MRSESKANRSILVRLLVIGVSVYMVITLAKLWNTLREKNAEYESLSAQKDSKQAEIDELRYILSDGSQTALIEKAARERLGYEYPDGIVYIDKSGN